MRPPWILTALVTLLVGCATGPPSGTPTVEQPRHAIGSEWEFRGRSSGSWSNVPQNPKFIFQGEREWQGRKLLSFGTFHLDDRMRFVARVRDGQPLETWEPYNNPVEFPLSVGRSWSTGFNYRNYESGRTYRDVRFWYKVEAWEDVTVPAGTFKAFRVGASEGGSDWAYWYAPDVKFFIKLKAERGRASAYGAGAFEWELVRYSLK